MSPRFGDDFVNWRSSTGGDDTGLGLVNFAMFPHLEHPDMPHNTMASALEWAAGMAPVPCYAIDDATGIRVVDGTLDVISEGHWKLLDPAS